MPRIKTRRILINTGRRSARLTAIGLFFLTACSTTPEAREATHMLRGKGYLQTKEYKKAVIEFKVASQNMPKDAEPVYQLGMTYLAGGAPRLAVEAFTKAVALNPGH
jgi:Tfp pilus assembly protein PilF